MARTPPAGHPGAMGDRQFVPAWLSFLLFTAIGGLVALDVALDAQEGLRWRHVLAELGVVAAAAVGAAGFATQWRRERRRLRDEVHRAEARAQTWQSEADLWREQASAALRGLGAAIDDQFDLWQLSPAEKEVGLLLLKGLSHQEVAAVRGTSVRTIGQQARALYRKGELGGRAELSAFFLEDLLLPERGDEV